MILNAGMSNTVFTTTSANELKAQPSVESEIVVRTDNAADEITIHVYGTISGIPGVSISTISGVTEVKLADEFTAITQAIISEAAGTVTGFLPGVAAVGDVRIDTNPADGDTLTLGLGDVVFVYRFKNTLTTAYDVKIGATAALTAANLKAAINADGTPGTEYNTGTFAHSIFSATVTTDVITLTDKIACLRQADYGLSESATNFSIRVPIGGLNGTTLFTISPEQTYAADALTFSAEDHTTTTLPALMTGTSPTIILGGRAAMLRIWGDNVVKYKIQTSTDQIHWYDSSEGEMTLTPSTMTYTHLAELHEFVQFVLTENTNTDDTVFDARVIY